MRKDTKASSEMRFFYHTFAIGTIGFLLSDDGLKEMDITDLNSDLTREEKFDVSSKPAWEKIGKEITSNEEGKYPVIVQIIDEFTSYFSGKLKKFSLPLAPEGTVFQKSVWNALIDIPYGEAISYQQLAMNIANPKAMRAVGSANGKNPLPIIIPCHRVIQANQTLGGYSGGLPTKIALLKLEGFSLIVGKSAVKVVQGQSDLNLE